MQNLDVPPRVDPSNPTHLPTTEAAAAAAALLHRPRSTVVSAILGFAARLRRGGSHRSRYVHVRDSPAAAGGGIVVHHSSAPTSHRPRHPHRHVAGMAVVTPFTLCVLLLLTFQNCAVSVLLRFVRTRKGVPQAAIGSVVLMQEVTKFAISLMWCAYDVWKGLPSDATGAATSLTKKDEGGGADGEAARESDGHEAGDRGGEDSVPVAVAVCRESERELRPEGLAQAPWVSEWVRRYLQQVFHSQGIRLLIPAALFSLQNTLLFVAMSHLQPTTFMVVYQSRLFLTAFLMVLLLGRSFSCQKWFSLAILVSGIVLTQVKTESGGSGRVTTPVSSADASASAAELPLVGFAATLACASSSSAAGVVMEKLMKDASELTFLSTKNVHLSFFSMVIIGTPIVYGSWFGGSGATGGGGNERAGFFLGFDGIVWIMIMNQALGGVLVALTLRYADNILKSFATTLAIVLGGVASYYMFGFIASPLFLLGSLTVFFAIFLYSSHERC